MGYIKWLGHAAFELELDGKIIYIDPWITNPLSPIRVEDIRAADIILVTHDHRDHLGEAIDLARKTNAAFISIYEISLKASQEGVRKAIGMNIGGSLTVEGITIIMTQALHSCERGNPTGFIIKGSEASIYHAGDTGLFYDMKLLGELYSPEIALLPIGGLFTMGPLEAAKAVELLKPRIVIPMHYNTFNAIMVDPGEFKKYVKEFHPQTEVVVLKPGERLNI